MLPFFIGELKQDGAKFVRFIGALVNRRTRNKEQGVLNSEQQVRSTFDIPCSLFFCS